jgi:hypothetical protein
VVLAQGAATATVPRSDLVQQNAENTFYTVEFDVFVSA